MKTVIVTVVLTLAVAIFVHWQSPHWLAEQLPSPDKATASFELTPTMGEYSPWIAGYGRVEPVSQERRLAFEINGLIADVLVQEGDTVQQGELLARLRDDEYTAKLEAAKADAKAQKAQYDKLVAGARKEEKSETLSAALRTKSIMQNAKVEMERRQELLNQDLIAKEEVDRASIDFLVAEREYEEARQRYLVMKNLSRKEDITTAWANYDGSIKRILEMQSLLDKTQLRSPVNGKVLRVHRQAGENVSIFFECPVVTVADVSHYQIRAEINEKFAALVELGQKAYFTSDTYGSYRFEGQISRIGSMTGPKTIHLDRPQEKKDTKILEIIIAIKDAQAMITGLTGDVFILINENADGLKAPVNNPTATSTAE